MNTFMVIGNLTRNPEMNAEKGFVKFGLADNDGYGEKERTNFYNVLVWGVQKEAIMKYMKKGSKVMIVGKLVVNTWAGEQGEKTLVNIYASDVRFLPSGGSDRRDEAAKKLSAKDVVEVDVDELPF